jgi:hypothetical protein
LPDPNLKPWPPASPRFATVQTRFTTSVLTTPVELVIPRFQSNVAARLDAMFFIEASPWVAAGLNNECTAWVAPRTRQTFDWTINSPRLRQPLAAQARSCSNTTTKPVSDGKAEPNIGTTRTCFSTAFDPFHNGKKSLSHSTHLSQNEMSTKFVAQNQIRVIWAAEKTNKHPYSSRERHYIYPNPLIIWLWSIRLWILFGISRRNLNEAARMTDFLSAK